jgi:proto-chlorophyllide reductase subunit
MKFLCVPCDQPMRLATVKPPDRGSLSVVYSCATCGYEMAMLTNPYETQVVASLGVKVGPQESAGAPASAAGGVAGSAAGATAAAAGVAGATIAAATGAHVEGGKEGGGKCPFAGMIPGLMGTDAATDDTTAPAGGTDGAVVAPGPGVVAPQAGAAVQQAGAGAAVPAWTDAASARLEVIPSFVRPMARTGIERFARERGYATIDEKVLDEARAFFGM